MKQFMSQIAPLIELFISYRQASGSWNETCYGLNIKLFDHFCAEKYPESTELTQEMVDSWCTKRETESNFSYDISKMSAGMPADYYRWQDYSLFLLSARSAILQPFSFENRSRKVLHSVSSFLFQEKSYIMPGHSGKHAEYAYCLFSVREHIHLKKKRYDGLSVYFL